MFFPLFLILGFVATLFVAWKIAKEDVYPERTIFDAVLLVGIGALIGSRLGYVFVYFDQFDINILKWITIGIYPGVLASGALVGSGVVLWYLSEKKISMKFGELVDLLTKASIVLIFSILIGALVTNAETGKALTLGFLKTHPVTFYRVVVVVLVITSMKYRKFLQKNSQPFTPGTYSLLFWLFITLGFFVVDFFGESKLLYWYLTPDQWAYAVISILCIIGFVERKKIHFFRNR